MMFFSDIHENPMFPYRNNSILTEAKDKYPFNKPLGISTDEEGVSQFLNQLISHIEEYYINDIIYNLEKPVVMDPLIELSMIQLYEENNKSSQFEDIIPHEIFFSLEQIRKNIKTKVELKIESQQNDNASQLLLMPNTQIKNCHPT